MVVAASGDALVRDVDAAAKLVDSINVLSNSMGINFSAAKDKFAWIGPVLTALQASPVCDADPSCSTTRVHLAEVTDPRNGATVQQINDLAGQLQGVGRGQTLTATVNKLNAALTNFTRTARAMGLDRPGGPRAGLSEVRQGADRLATGSRQVAGGVDELVAQIGLMSKGLDEASAFLLNMKHDASDPAMAPVWDLASSCPIEERPSL